MSIWKYVWVNYWFHQRKLHQKLILMNKISIYLKFLKDKNIKISINHEILFLPQNGSRIFKKKPNPEFWVTAKTLKSLHKMGNIACTKGWVLFRFPGVINITGTFYLWLNYVSLNTGILANIWNSHHDVQWSLRCPHQRQAVEELTSDKDHGMIMEPG